MASLKQFPETGALYTQEMKDAIRRFKREIVQLHTHPNDNPPTGSDFISLARNGYVKGYVVTKSGKLYEYQVIKNEKLEIFDGHVEKYKLLYYTDTEEAILRALEKYQREGLIKWHTTT